MEPANNIWASVIMSIAQDGLRKQKARQGDYYNEDGFLICGKCGKPRQQLLEIKGQANMIKVACECDCDAEERRINEEKQRELEDRRIVAELKRASFMDARLKDVTFDLFEINKWNEKNVKICKRYVDKFDDMLAKHQGILMWGDVGTGKSFAAAAIANSLIQKKVPVVMTSFVKILEAINTDRSEESVLLGRIRNAKLVIFDDLGAERSTDYALEKVYNIINDRYLQGLPMILTTNLTIEEMKQDSDMRYSRIYDRIFETCYPIQFTGPSWRKRSASKRFDEMRKILEGDD